MIIFDVGAERGRYTDVYLDMYPNAEVYAFEPAPTALKVLNKRAEEEPRLTVVPVAVLDEAGEVEFNIASADVYNSVLELAPGWTRHVMVAQIVVPAITLDGFCADNGIKRIDLLKIDVQGAELKVLQGATRLLDAGAVYEIDCELNHLERYEGQGWAPDVLAFLAGHSYYQDVEKTTFTYEGGVLLFTNGVFTR